MTRYIQFVSIVLVMHVIGSVILVGYFTGPSEITQALHLGVLAGYFILGCFVFPLEFVGVFFQWLLYDPYPKPSPWKILGYALLSAVIGGAVAAIVIPKPLDNQVQYWIACYLAGAGASVTSFMIIHLIKNREPKTLNKASLPTGINPTTSTPTALP
jgi:hypothetical protein